jgi:hypothetical protein
MRAENARGKEHADEVKPQQYGASQMPRPEVHGHFSPDIIPIAVQVAIEWAHLGGD